jgi:serine/threonine-protein kinase
MHKKTGFITSVFVVTGLLFPSTAVAADWVQLITTDEAVHHIDVGSIKVHGGIRKFWKKTTYFEEQQSRYGESYINQSEYTTVNCPEKTLGFARVIAYDWSGSVVFDAEKSSYIPTGLTAVVPDSIGEAIVDFVCRRKIVTPSSSASKSITQQQAVSLVSRWLQAKRKIFASPFDRQLVVELTTGKRQTDTIGAQNWLKNNNSYYRYGVQKVESVKRFVASGNAATIEVRVTEDYTLYHNGKVDPSQTDFKSSLIRYNLQSVGGKWKIADYKSMTF